MDFVNGNEELRALHDDGIGILSISSEQIKQLKKEAADGSIARRKFEWTHGWFCDNYLDYCRLFEALSTDPGADLDAKLLLFPSEPTDAFLDVCRIGHLEVTKKRNEPIGAGIGESSYHDGLDKAFKSLFYLAAKIRKDPKSQAKLATSFLNHRTESVSYTHLTLPTILLV